MFTRGRSCDVCRYGRVLPLIAVKKFLTPQVRQGQDQVLFAVRSAPGMVGRGRFASGDSAGGRGRIAVADSRSSWWGLVVWWSADAGRSAATGAGGSAKRTVAKGAQRSLEVAGHGMRF